MKEQLIHEVQRKMLPYLNNEQLLQLGDALSEALRGVSVSYEDTTPKQEERDAVEAFISAKRIEGCSEKTLKYYRKTIESMLSAIAKKAIEKGITEVVFDRGGYIYHGRVQALAEGAREGGLKL